MISLRAVRRISAGATLCLAVTACHDGPKSCGILNPTRSLTATPTNVTVDVGQTKSVDLTFMTTCSDDPNTVDIVSGSPTIASVTRTVTGATITGLAPGAATLTATAAAGPTTTLIAVTVRALAPTTLTVTPANDTLSPLGTRQLTSAVRDQNGAALPGATVVWRSLTPSLASVSSTGLVTASATGSATVQAKVATGTGTDSLTAITTILILPPCLRIRPIQFGVTYDGTFDASSCQNFLGFPMVDQFGLTSATQVYYAISLTPTAPMSLVALNLGSEFYGSPASTPGTALVNYGVMRAGTFGFMVAPPNTTPSSYRVSTQLNPDPGLTCAVTDVTRGVTFTTAMTPTCQTRDIRILPRLQASGRIVVTARAPSYPIRIDLMVFGTNEVLRVGSVANSGDTATIDYVNTASRFVYLRIYGGPIINDRSIAISIDQ